MRPGVGLYTWRIELHWLQFVRRRLSIRGLPRDLVGRTLVQISDVHVGRHLVLEVDAKDETDARAQTGRMCAQLLANPVTEDFEIASVSGA